MPTKIFLVAGEASADLAGANLVRDLKRLLPGASFFGVGGKRLVEQGMEVLVPSEALSVVGVMEWWDRAKDIVLSYRKILKSIEQKKPDLAILIDLPDFNLRVAKKLKKLGVPVIYYVSPQVWAWRKNRIKLIKERVDEMLVVFPFEKEIYEKAGVPVSFVGHPLVELLQPRRRYRDQAVIQKTPRIALMPGSRKSEIRNHAAILRGLMERIKEEYPDSQIRVPIAPTLSVSWVSEKLGLKPHEVSEDSWDTLHWADIAVVASGTATLETALIGTPFCLFYKVSPSSSWLLKNIIKYQGFIGMPNILLSRQVVKECFQENASPDKIFSELKFLINSGPSRLNMVSSLLTCRKLLGERGDQTRAASRVVEHLKKKQMGLNQGSHDSNLP